MFRLTTPLVPVVATGTTEPGLKVPGFSPGCYNRDHPRREKTKPGDVVPVDNTFSPGCSNQDYEAGTKGPAL